VIGSRELKPLFDGEAVRAQLTALRRAHPSDEAGLRAAILKEIKERLATARARIEETLEADGKGLACARRIASVQDELVHVLTDFAAQHLYRAHNPSSAERIAIAAVGGYGRGTLAPGSDVDLLFLLPYKQTPWGESVIEFVLYALWDLGFKVGHASRTIDECLRLSRSDLTIRTALLEARFVWGERPLFETFAARFDAEVVAGSGPEFIAAKLAERDARHARMGESRYVVEPNVKDGKGGLRDLQTLFWIAKYHYRVSSGEELVKAGVFSRGELKRFRKCADFLWAVRCHLHFMTGRPEERLSFDLQRELAQRLGYTSHPGARDVERFMKHYFLVAKDVGDLTRIFCASLEMRHVKTAGVLSQVIARLKPPRRIPGYRDFVVTTGRVNVADAGAFERDPVNLIRIFHLADQLGLDFHPDALKLVRRSLKRIDKGLRNDPEANRLFLDILTSRGDPETVLRRMNEAGVLGRFLPEFGRIVALVQFNMYHHYTVDEHLLRAVGILASIERGELAADHPLSHSIIGTLENRRALYVAVFLHDIAKGRPEDHSIAGARIARRICPRLGLSPAETDTVAWLIQHHLAMSHFAQSRDLADPKTTADFAALVQSAERLKLLLLLTVADIRAVGPGVWNGWKGQLLRTLYTESEPAITGGHTEVSRKERLSAARAGLRARLTDWTDAEFEAYAERHYPPYWLKMDVDRQAAHARMVREADAQERRFAVSFVTDAFRGVTELTIYAPDHPHLLSDIAGACAAAQADIMDAYIFTTSDGMALDTIFVRRAYAHDADEYLRAERLGEVIEAAMAGHIRMPERVAERAGARARRLKAFALETQIVVNNSWSERFTVIEVSGLDRPALLYDLTNALSQLSLNIGSAHIATFGERAVDSFYVTDLTGQKITNPARQVAIREALTGAFEGAREDGREAA
jgi:[protein-PII] uridylyltransferase